MCSALLHANIRKRVTQAQYASCYDSAIFLWWEGRKQGPNKVMRGRVVQVPLYIVENNAASMESTDSEQKLQISGIKLAIVAPVYLYHATINGVACKFLLTGVAAVSVNSAQLFVPPIECLNSPFGCKKV